MNYMRRADAKRQIRDAIFQRLQDELHSEGRLAGLKGVHDGERVRLLPELPAVFVIRETETVVQQRIHQTFEYELSFLAIVTNEDPEIGLTEAEDWAAEASYLATQEPRDLGLPFVNDAKLVRSVPVSDPHTEGRKIGSIDIIQVTYTIVQE